MYIAIVDYACSRQYIAIPNFTAGSIINYVYIRIYIVIVMLSLVSYRALFYVTDYKQP